MPDFQATIKFEVFCGICGANISATSNGTGIQGHRDSPFVTVDPCAVCRQTWYDLGYEECLSEEH